MNYPLIAAYLSIACQSLTLVVALVTLVFVYLLYRKTAADDAALYLQGERIRRVQHEMMESLREPKP